MSKYILFLTLLTGAAKSPGQNLPKTLLWKISGHGLKSPSFLFGTLHLADSRIFWLGDSVFKAISSAQGLVLEMDPRHLTRAVLNEVKKEGSGSQRIQNLLSPGQFQEYGPLLAKKLGKPADRITTYDIWLQQNKWSQGKGNYRYMPVFLDGYLYNLALGEGKWLGGLENIQDQEKALGALVDQSDIAELALSSRTGSSFGLEILIALYRKQNLPGLDQLLNLQERSHKDPILIRRNIHMVHNLDSLMAIRSLFAAVGVAHLPGDSGLIHLLRIQGYRVSPVFSSRLVPPGITRGPQSRSNWVRIADPGRLYQVDMPDTPVRSDRYGIPNSLVYIDAVEGMSYATAALPRNTLPANTNSLLDLLRRRLFSLPGHLNAYPLDLDGARGQFIRAFDAEGEKEAYILVRGPWVFLAEAMTTSLDSSSSWAMGKFLSSFRLLKPPALETGFPFRDSSLAFEAIWPRIPPTLASDAGDGDSSGIRSWNYSESDPATGDYLMIGISQMAPGSYMEDDSLSLTKIRAAFLQELSRVLQDSSYLATENWNLEIRGITRQDGQFFQSHLRFRGNRWYTQLAVYSSPQPGPLIRRFFGSFQLLPYPQQDWAQRSSPDNLFSDWTPAPIKEAVLPGEDSSMNQSGYLSYDGSRGSSFGIIGRTLVLASGTKQDSLFWARRISSRLRPGDTLISEIPVRNGPVQGWEILKKQIHSQTFVRLRILEYRDREWVLFCGESLRNLYDPDADRFFQDFRFLDKPH